MGIQDQWPRKRTRNKNKISGDKLGWGTASSYDVHGLAARSRQAAAHTAQPTQQKGSLKRVKLGPPQGVELTSNTALKAASWGLINEPAARLQRWLTSEKKGKTPK